MTATAITADAVADRPQRSAARLGGLRHEDDRLAQPRSRCSGSRSCSCSRPIQPVIFVLMFRYVFGGAIQRPGLFPTSTT